MKLVFLHGLPGVGKFTVGSDVARLTGFPLFHNHLTVDLVTTLFDFGSPEFVSLREHIWLEAFGRAATSGMAGLVFTFAGERTVTSEFVPTVTETVEAAGGEVVFLELTCSDEELRRRVASPERRKFGKLDSVELLDALRADGTLYSLAVPRSARSVVVDTTDRTPAESASEISRLIGD